MSGFQAPKLLPIVGIVAVSLLLGFYVGKDNERRRMEAQAMALVTGATDQYPQPITRSAERACRTNVETLSTVAQTYRTLNPEHVYPTSAQLDSHLVSEGQPVLALFKGPNDETYTYVQGAGGISFMITCNASPSHGMIDQTGKP